MNEVIRTGYQCYISYQIEASHNLLPGMQLTKGSPEVTSGEKVVRFAEKYKGKQICLRYADRPDLTALVAESETVCAEIRAEIEVKNVARRAAEKAKDQPFIDAMNAKVAELKKQLPANHVFVTATQTGDMDGDPIMAYEAAGVNLKWDEINVIGWASAIRPGALGAFEQVCVCSIDRDALVQSKIKHEEEAIASAAKKAEYKAKLQNTVIPDDAISDYNRYHGNADKAWEAEDEGAWAMIEKWSPYIEAQNGMHPEKAKEFLNEAMREANYGINEG